MKRISLAASNVCVYIESIYDYNVIMKTLRPKQLQCEEMEKEINKVSVFFCYKCWRGAVVRRCILI